MEWLCCEMQWSCDPCGFPTLAHCFTGGQDTEAQRALCALHGPENFPDSPGLSFDICKLGVLRQQTVLAHGPGTLSNTTL